MSSNRRPSDEQQKEIPPESKPASSTPTSTPSDQPPTQPARMVRPSDIIANSKAGSTAGSGGSTYRPSYYTGYYSGMGSTFGYEQLDAPLDEEAWNQIRKTLSMTAADVEAKIKAEEAAKKLEAMTIDDDGEDAKPSASGDTKAPKDAAPKTTSILYTCAGPSSSFASSSRLRIFVFHYIKYNRYWPT